MTEHGDGGARPLRRLRALLGNPWVKTGVTLVLLGFVLYWLRGQMPFLRQGFDAIGRPHWGWLAVAAGMSFLSMSSYGSVQKTLLGSAGVRVGYWDSLGLIMVANAFSTCIPGGQVVGATITYRRTRAWGATRVIASWQLVLSGVLATTGLVILALGGFAAVGSVSNPFLLLVSGLGLLGIVALIQWAAGNPGRVESALLPILARVNRWRRKPEDAGADAIAAVVDQIEAVELSRGQLATAFVWSLVNWVADIGCLWAAALTVGADHSIGGLSLAYVTGKIVGTAPLTPGGLGTVEVALVTTLTAGGMAASQAFASVFIYRIVSFVLVALAGWVVFALAYRGAMGVDPDDDEDDDDVAAGVGAVGTADAGGVAAGQVAATGADRAPRVASGSRRWRPTGYGTRDGIAPRRRGDGGGDA